MCTFLHVLAHCTRLVQGLPTSQPQGQPSNLRDWHLKIALAVAQSGWLATLEQTLTRLVLILENQLRLQHTAQQPVLHTSSSTAVRETG